jgi:hypothetical protein
METVVDERDLAIDNLKVLITCARFMVFNVVQNEDNKTDTFYEMANKIRKLIIDYFPFEIDENDTISREDFGSLFLVDDNENKDEVIDKILRDYAKDHDISEDSIDYERIDVIQAIDIMRLNIESKRPDLYGY